MSDAELDLSDYDDYLSGGDDDAEMDSPLDSESEGGGQLNDDQGGGGEGSDSGFSPFASSTPVSNSYKGGGHKGKGRASLGEEKLYGQVEYRVLSLNQLEMEQKVAVDYVQDMLKLKVSPLVCFQREGRILTLSVEWEN